MGCLFHFCRGVYGEIQQFGLATTHPENEDFALKARYPAMFASVPPGDIVASLGQRSLPLRGPLPGEREPLVDYFEETWIGITPAGGGGRRAPRLPTQLRKQYRRVLEEKARTDNAVEAFLREGQISTCPWLVRRFGNRFLD